MKNSHELRYFYRYTFLSVLLILLSCEPGWIWFPDQTAQLDFKKLVSYRKVIKEKQILEQIKEQSGEFKLKNITLSNLKELHF